ncbi:MAG: hypothetical protein WCB18_09475 [Thermoplasmata archaeon]
MSPRAWILFGLILAVTGGSWYVYTWATFHAALVQCPPGAPCAPVLYYIPLGEWLGSVIALAGAFTLLVGIVKWFRERAERIEADRRTKATG